MKCTARRTNGEPCNAWAIKGGTVCRSHGGSIKHVRDAANRRLAEQEAAKTVATLGARLDITPSEALLEEVQWTAGHVAWLRAKVQDLNRDDDGGGGGDLTWGITRMETGLVDKTIEEAKPSIWYTLYAQERDRLITATTAALKAGVEERRVHLAEQQGQLIATVIHRILDALHLTPDQAALVPTVVPRALRQITGAP